MRFLQTLTFRVLAGSCLLLLAVFALYSWFAVRFHTDQMMAQMQESADRVSDIVKQSTHYSMLLNRREDVFQIITTIASEPGVDGIRIFNKRGEIMFSTHKKEEGKVVDMRAEACFGCHSQAEPLKSLPLKNRSRVYRGADGYRSIGLINPIRNEAACWTADCHVHPAEQTVLGVLDVRMSLARVDANIAHARRNHIRYAIAASLAMAMASGLFLYLMVHRPVRKLMEGIRQISSGNLDCRIPEAGHGDVSALARMFNDMTASLQRARKENNLWSETLERRVEEKSLELRQIHERILQIEKMASLGKLSATVAHELNNPLEGILTYAKLIARRIRKERNPSELTKQTLEELDLVIREVQRCGDIVKNLLLFSRMQVVDFNLVEVRGIVDKAVRLVQHHLKVSKVTLEAEYAAADLKLLCDENQIQQALVALMVNAVESMPAGGILRLKVDQSPGGDLRMQVADTGCGIPKEDLPHVFEPFFTTKKQGQGVGLGLSVVYGIVERHGGRISVQSEAGQGTVFTMTFTSATAPHPRIEKAPEHSTIPVV